MPKQIQLRDQHSEWLIVQEGESYNFEGTFKDVSSTPVALTSDDILTLTATLFAGTAILNSRNDQSIKNENDGTLDVDGNLVLKLGPLDNVIDDGALVAEALEKHVLRIKWTWNDGTNRTGISEYVFQVQKLASPS